MAGEEREERVRVRYDGKRDTLCLWISDDLPDGIMNLPEGINLDVTSDGRIVGVEIANASKRVDLVPLLGGRMAGAEGVTMEKGDEVRILVL